MATIESVYIQLTLGCNVCGHQWCVEDIASLSVSYAGLDAEETPCPKCGE